MSIKKCFSRICLSIGLFCVVVFSSSCQVTWPLKHEKSLLVRMGFDVSRESGVSPMSATSLVDVLLPSVIQRRGVIEFYRLDDVEGAKLIGRFVTGVPVSESRAAIASFERNRLAEGKNSFGLLLESIFSSPPRSSKLALALTVMSVNIPKDTEVRYVLNSDAREYGQGVDFECFPPSIDNWTAILQRDGLLPAGSLKGATVNFVGVRPLMSTPGNRCPATLGMSNQVRSLWENAITNAGGKVTFSSDSSDPSFPLVLSTLFLGGNTLLTWRKMRIRQQAKKDRKEVRYAFLARLHESIGPKPGLDESDPQIQQWINRLAHLEISTNDLRSTIKELCLDIANHTPWKHLAIGCAFATLTEMITWPFLYRDAGVPAPERYLMGAMTGMFVIMLIGFAVKHAQETGRRAWLIASIAIISIIVLAATTVRVANAMANGGELYQELAFAVLIAIGALGPGLFLERLMEPLKAVLPKARRLRELKKQLRKELRELRTVTGKLAYQASIRRAWEWTKAVLQGAYDGYNMPPNNPGSPNNPPPNSPTIIVTNNPPTNPGDQVCKPSGF
jgi:hypothetical protein